jgi:hypothetical protein
VVLKRIIESSGKTTSEKKTIEEKSKKVTTGENKSIKGERKLEIKSPKKIMPSDNKLMKSKGISEQTLQRDESENRIDKVNTVLTETTGMSYGEIGRRMSILGTPIDDGLLRAQPILQELWKKYEEKEAELKVKSREVEVWEKRVREKEKEVIDLKLKLEEWRVRYGKESERARVLEKALAAIVDKEPNIEVNKTTLTSPPRKRVKSTEEAASNSVSVDVLRSLLGRGRGGPCYNCQRFGHQSHSCPGREPYRHCVE